MKASLRKRLSAARAGLSPAVRVAAHAAMTDHLLAVCAEVAAETVAVYAALANEADPRGFAVACRAAGRRVVYPRIAPRRALTFHEITDQPLVPGFRGILEPPPDTPEVARGAIDLLVVPGVGFDPDGRRLGVGGGYYDRLLSAPDRPRWAVGLAYAAQVVACVPTEDHDRAVDAVVTERGATRVPGRWPTP